MFPSHYIHHCRLGIVSNVVCQSQATDWQAVSGNRYTVLTADTVFRSSDQFVFMKIRIEKYKKFFFLLRRLLVFLIIGLVLQHWWVFSITLIHSFVLPAVLLLLLLLLFVFVFVFYNNAKARSLNLFRYISHWWSAPAYFLPLQEQVYTGELLQGIYPHLLQVLVLSTVLLQYFIACGALRSFALLNQLYSCLVSIGFNFLKIFLFLSSFTAQATLE